MAVIDAMMAFVKDRGDQLRSIRCLLFCHNASALHAMHALHPMRSLIARLCMVCGTPGKSDWLLCFTWDCKQLSE